MKINELIEILNRLSDKEGDVFIINQENIFTSNIGYSIDDNNDVQLFEIGEDVFLENNLQTNLKK